MKPTKPQFLDIQKMTTQLDPMFYSKEGMDIDEVIKILEAVKLDVNKSTSKNNRLFLKFDAGYNNISVEVLVK